jgi:competence protein ComEC
VGSFCYWLLTKKKYLVFCTIGFGCLFFSANIIKQHQTDEQAKIIVYNIPRLSGIDFIKSNQFEFVGDSILEQDGSNKSFHIKPSRIFFNTFTHQQKLTYQNKALYSFANKNFLLINDHYSFENKSLQPLPIEAVVISKNPQLYIDSLLRSFVIKNVVADATNPSWKIKKWNEDCKRLGIPFHYTGEKGAFVMDL